MLQIKHIKLIQDLTGETPSKIKAVKFGLSTPYTSLNAITLAEFVVPQNKTLLVLRTQCYMINTDDADSGLPDYQFYRAYPRGAAFWRVLRPPATAGFPTINWTDPTAPAQNVLDVDEYLLFPANQQVQLRLDPEQPPPTLGTFVIQTTIFGYLVDSVVSQKLGTSQSWTYVSI